jgi:hypothetical protein
MCAPPRQDEPLFRPPTTGGTTGWTDLDVSVNNALCVAVREPVEKIGGDLPHDGSRRTVMDPAIAELDERDAAVFQD